MQNEATFPGEAEGGEPRPLALTLGSRLNLDELWRWRSRAWRGPTPTAVELDLAEVVEIEPEAALLLFTDLAALDGRGVPVRLRGAAKEIRRLLQRHPICRYLSRTDTDDQLFTDPDLDGTGFRPSRH